MAGPYMLRLIRTAPLNRIRDIQTQNFHSMVIKLISTVYCIQYVNHVEPLISQFVNFLPIRRNGTNTLHLPNVKFTYGHIR